MKAFVYVLAAAVAGSSALDPALVAGDRTRQPALAGGWYPEGRAALVSAAHLLMRIGAKAETPSVHPVALVVPHAGWSYSGPVAGAAFRLLRPNAFDRVVVMGPSHQEGFRGYALDDARAWRTPAGELPLCDGVLPVLHGPPAQVRSSAMAAEHSIEIELPFLQAALGRFCLVPILVGDTSAGEERSFAARLAKLDDGRTLFVFSSDFSHYGPRFGYQPFGPLSADVRRKVRSLDERAVGILARKDAAGFRAYLGETGNTICGRNDLATLLELLPRVAPQAEAVRLAHYSSADVSGANDDSSVSYVAMAFLRQPPGSPIAPIDSQPVFADAPADKPALRTEAGRRLVRLARAALETELRQVDDLQHALAEYPSGPEHEERQGVFVTLNRKDPDEIRRHGRLRGCIGQPAPTYPLYYGTVQAALDAALRDPRFEPVTAAELPGLEVEVTVLSPRRPIASWREIELGRHGIVLEKDGSAALFLPQVAPEQGWTVEQTLDELALKAGLSRKAWREGARLSVFTGQVFAEHP